MGACYIDHRLVFIYINTYITTYHTLKYYSKKLSNNIPFNTINIINKVIKDGEASMVYSHPNNAIHRDDVNRFIDININNEKISNIKKLFELNL